MSVLAIEGGSAVRSEPMAPWPYFSEDEIQSVVSVLNSGKVNYWTGSFVKSFEESFAKYHDMKHGIALANGTLALELALMGCGIRAGDEVITTCRTFIASASCVVRVGAIPVLAEVDADSQNITPETIEAQITPRTKAIIVVHLAGWPCDMPGIMKLAEKHGIKVIEDCAQSHGAKISGRLCGSWGHMSAFSFCQDKIITTGGEGGMLLLNDSEVFERLWAFKDHGKSYDAVYRRAHPPGFRWLHESFGTNWRLTEMQAVIGIMQLEKLSSWVEKRRFLSGKILSGLKGQKGLRIPEPKPDIYHSFYKFYVFVEPSVLKVDWSRDRVMAAISAEGVACLAGSCSEIYRETAFVEAHLGPRERFPVARSLGETSLMFLVHPTLDETYAEDVVLSVRKVMSEATL